MTVENTDTVDMIGIDNKSGEVVLTISDHLNWSNSFEHQMTLQRKFNSYLAFVEGGEIVTRYPDAKDRPVAFRVVFRFKPDQSAEEFLNRARIVVESAGFKLRWEVFADSYEN